MIWSTPMRALCLLLSSLAAISLTAPTEAADLWRDAHARHVGYGPPVVYPIEPFCPWCIRDAIYTDTKRIAHLEANPDVDDADKAPWILGGRAEIHELRRVLGPVHTVYVGPCCYWRKRFYVR